MKPITRTYAASTLLLGLLGLAFLGIETFGQTPAPPGAAIEKKPAWQSSASVGFTVTAGNSETLLGVAAIGSKRKFTHAEAALGADATYGETTLPGSSTSVKNAESAHGFGQYNHLFNPRFFAYARADVLHDAIADVEFRLSLGPGAGYYFVKTPKLELVGEIGPGWIYEKLGSGSDHYMTLRLAEKLNYHLSDKTRLWQAIEIQPQIDNIENYLVTGEIGIEATLVGKVKLRTYIQDTFDNEPAPGRKKNDFKWVTAIAYEF